MQRPQLFLDIDGVLNSRSHIERVLVNKDYEWPEDAIDPKAVEILNTIVDLTSAEVVISSSWRIIDSSTPIDRRIPWSDFDDLVDFLKRKGVKADIVGRTPSLVGPRGREIRDWLEENRPDTVGFAILDDDSDMEELSEHLVQTSYEEGLQHQHIAEAVFKLLQKRVTVLSTGG